MNISKILLGAALVGGLVSTSAFAAGEAPTAWPQAVRSDKPTVLKVVNPSGLSQRHEGQVVDVAFTVDKQGQPHNIRVMAANDPSLERCLQLALAQWRFAPLQKNGVPVSSRVEMPLQLISNS